MDIFIECHSGGCIQISWAVKKQMKYIAYLRFSPHKLIGYIRQFLPPPPPLLPVICNNSITSVFINMQTPVAASSRRLVTPGCQMSFGIRRRVVIAPTVRLN